MAIQTTGFCLNLGYAANYETVEEKQFYQELAAWFDDHDTLEGFKLSTGEEPRFSVVYQDWQEA